MTTPRKTNEGLEKLIAQAKGNPQFFHDLVFKTEQVLGSLDYLTREEKASILAIRPEDLISGLAAGNFAPGGAVASCGATCGGSCTATCGGSCTATCAASCPLTGAMPDSFEQVINPASFAAVSAEQIGAQVLQQLGTRPFTRFARR